MELLAMRKTGMALLMFTVYTAGTVSSTTAEELTWRNDIEPMIAANCGSCHGPDEPTYREWRLLSEEERTMVGPRMDTYEHFMSFVLWPATGAMQRRLDDGTNRGGEPGNMHGYLGETDEERADNLEMLKEWLGAWNLNRWEARDDVPGISKEQLEAISAKY
jgi:hypothetical protein